PTGGVSVVLTSTGAGRICRHAPHALTRPAEEAPATALAVDLPPQRAAASRTDGAAVNLEVLSQREHAPQLEEPERERSRVGDDRLQALVGQAPDALERARARPEEHLVLDDVADAGEDALI